MSSENNLKYEENLLMKIRLEEVDYGTGVFRLIAFDIDPNGEDAERVAAIRSEIDTHGAAPYAPSGRVRGKEELDRTRYLGILAEKVFGVYLKRELEPDANVIQKPYTDFRTHVDIEIEKDSKRTTIEVRSSYAAGSLLKIIKNLHALGPYTTSYKPNETPKDFYLCGLLHEETKLSFSNSEKHTLYFAGGGPYSKFESEGKPKSLRQEGAEYLAIRIWKAMDAVDTMEEIRSFISGV